MALIAYATYAWSDAAIKALGGSLTIFEIGFYQTAIAGAAIFLARPGGASWNGFWRMRHPWRVQARALIGLAASVLSVFAFTTVPLAEVYAIIFLSPLFVTLLSIVLLKEQVGPWRWFAIAAGFVGVLLVVRPGFRSLELGHGAAVIMAMLSASSIILMRSLSGREKPTTILGFLILYGVVFNGIAMAMTKPVLPTPAEWAILLFAGLCAASGHIMLLRATRFAEANQLAPTHYSQIIWAVVIGAALFHEQPDALAMTGLAVIAGSGLLTVARERIRLGTVRWNPFGRTRL
jgi:drug/metabolite transporter (DMT)-like permease